MEHLFTKVNKIDKLIARLTEGKKAREKRLLTNIRHEIRDTVTVPTDTLKRIIKKYYE